jgi:hypothetical protein
VPIDITNAPVSYDGGGLISERYGMTPSPGDDLGPYGCGGTPDANGNFYAWNSGCTIRESQQIYVAPPVENLPPLPPLPPKPKQPDLFVELARDISRRTAPVPWLVQGFIEVSTAFVSPWLQAGLCAVTSCTPVGATMAAIPFGPGQIASMERVLAAGGKGAVTKAIASFERNIAEHEAKIVEAAANGGYTSSMEREVRNWRALVAAGRSLLGR